MGKKKRRNGRNPKSTSVLEMAFGEENLNSIEEKIDNVVRKEANEKLHKALGSGSRSMDELLSRPSLPPPSTSSFLSHSSPLPPSPRRSLSSLQDMFPQIESETLQSILKAVDYEIDAAISLLISPHKPPNHSQRGVEEEVDEHHPFVKGVDDSSTPTTPTSSRALNPPEERGGKGVEHSLRIEEGVESTQRGVLGVSERGEKGVESSRWSRRALRAINSKAVVEGEREREGEGERERGRDGDGEAEEMLRVYERVVEEIRDLGVSEKELLELLSVYDFSLHTALATLASIHQSLYLSPLFSDLTNPLREDIERLFLLPDTGKKLKRVLKERDRQYHLSLLNLQVRGSSSSLSLSSESLSATVLNTREGAERERESEGEVLGRNQRERSSEDEKSLSEQQLFQKSEELRKYARQSRKNVGKYGQSSALHSEAKRLQHLAEDRVFVRTNLSRDLSRSIDLHGQSVENGRKTLERYMETVEEHNLRVRRSGEGDYIRRVEIICGRGKHSHSGTSVLLKSTKEWLHENGYGYKERQQGAVEVKIHTQ